MPRRKKGRAISGWLIVDKPEELGSTQAVGKVRWLFGAQKAGHAGTLDPLASGMLPIALGDATRTVPHVMEGEKTYRFTVQWGEERTTDDREGEVSERSGERPTRAEIEALLPRYTGMIQQAPPAYSAIKVNGERAYKLARDGDAKELPTREVEVRRFELVEANADSATFEVDCGKGTYVRAFARDMGRELGCFGHIAKLRRTGVAPFDEEDLIPWDRIIATEDMVEAERHEALDAMLYDTVEALDGQPNVELTKDQLTRVLSGNPIILRGRDAPLPTDDAHATHRGELIALGRIDKGAFHPRRVFGGGGGAG